MNMEEDDYIWLVAIGVIVIAAAAIIFIKKKGLSVLSPVKTFFSTMDLQPNSNSGTGSNGNQNVNNGSGSISRQQMITLVSNYDQALNYVLANRAAVKKKGNSRYLMNNITAYGFDIGNKEYVELWVRELTRSNYLYKVQWYQNNQLVWDADYRDGSGTYSQPIVKNSGEPPFPYSFPQNI